MIAPTISKTRIPPNRVRRGISQRAFTHDARSGGIRLAQRLEQRILVWASPSARNQIHWRQASRIGGVILVEPPVVCISRLGIREDIDDGRKIVGTIGEDKAARSVRRIQRREVRVIAPTTNVPVPSSASSSLQREVLASGKVIARRENAAHEAHTGAALVPAPAPARALVHASQERRQRLVSIVASPRDRPHHPTERAGSTGQHIHRDCRPHHLRAPRPSCDRPTRRRATPGNARQMRPA